MNKLILVFFITVLLGFAGIAVATQIYYEIPATTVDNTYNLNATAPLWLKIELNGLVANTSMDNLGLSFRDSSFNEILNIFIKTSGDIHITSPKYGIPDTQLGQWRDGTEIYVHFDENEITVYIGYPTTTNISYSFTASNYDVYDVRVHSNDDTNKAFTSGTIIIQETTIVDLSETIKSLTSLVYSLMPLIISLIGIAIPIMFIKYIMRFLRNIL